MAAQAAGATLRAAPALPRDHRRCRAATTSTRSPQRSRRRTRLVYLANPNNPTGTLVSASTRSRRSWRSVPRGRAGRASTRPTPNSSTRRTAIGAALLARIPNLVVTRTFSKAYALAGLRVGYRRRASGAGRGDGTRARELQRQHARAWPRAEAALGDDAHLQWVAARATPRSARGSPMRCARAAGSCIPRRPISCWSNSARDTAADRGGAARARRGAAADGRLRPAAIACASPSATRDENRRLLAALDALRMIAADRADWIASPGAPLRGNSHVPGDKSVSHRAIMLAAHRRGRARASRASSKARTPARPRRSSSSSACASKRPAPARASCMASASTACRRRTQPLDCGNAGTGMRLLAGLLAGQRFDSVLIGDASLSTRPMRRVIDPLARMGARIDAHDGLPPLRIARRQAVARHRLRAAEVASAQVKSARAARGPVREGRNRRARAASDARLHRAHAAPRSAGRSNSRRATRGCRAGIACARPTCRCRRISRRPRSSWSRRRVVPGSDLRAARGGHEPAPHRPAARAARDGRATSTSKRSRRAGRRSRSPTCTCATRRCTASTCRWTRCPT